MDYFGQKDILDRIVFSFLLRRQSRIFSENNKKKSKIDFFQNTVLAAFWGPFCWLITNTVKHLKNWWEKLVLMGPQNAASTSIFEFNFEQQLTCRSMFVLSLSISLIDLSSSLLFSRNICSGVFLLPNRNDILPNSVDTIM